MSKILILFEKAIITALLVLMMLAVFAAAVELAVILFRDILDPPLFLLNMEEILDIFGSFLLVLIGLELIDVIKAYLKDDKVHAEVVFLVAIVAISRKVIIVDLKETSPEMLFGMAALIIALGIGYFLVRRAMPILVQPDKSQI